MTLFYIVLATLTGGVFSVALAGSLTMLAMGRLIKHLVSLSTGVMLATSLLHILPEAFENGIARGIDVHRLFATLLGGLLFFFLLEKVELYRHVHHHEGDGHDHPHDFDEGQAGLGGFSVLVGDSIHNFCDGFIVAAAFMVSTELGVVTSLAIVAHEIPHQIGDVVVLLNAGFKLRKALLYSALSGSSAVVGGVLGYFVVGSWQPLFPYLLVVSASSFIYVAVADLIPQMQRQMQWREMLVQICWIAAGLALASGLARLMDAHEGSHGAPDKAGHACREAYPPVATGRAGSALHSLQEPG